MTALSTLPAIGKFVPLLGSDKDGEILAAAAAIGRTLRRSGFDWHDLNRAIEIGAATMAPVRKSEPATDEQMTAQDVARFILGRQAELSAAERDFVRTVMKRLAYGDQISEKQQKWLRAIYVSLGGRQ